MIQSYVAKRAVKGSLVAAATRSGRPPALGAFWLTVGIVATKNAIDGSLLVREDRAAVALLLFLVAIGVESTIRDRGMHEDLKSTYDGLWFPAGGIIAGAFTLGVFVRAALQLSL